MYEMKVKATEIQRSASLSSHKVLHRVPVLKVAVIGHNIARLWEAFEVVMPIFECADDPQHLLIIDFIVSLSINYRLGMEGHGVPKFIGELLKKDAACCITRGVHFYTCGTIWFPHHEDGFGGERTLKE